MRIQFLKRQQKHKVQGMDALDKIRIVRIDIGREQLLLYLKSQEDKCMDKLMTYQDSGNDETDLSLRNHFYTIMDNSETETIAEFTV